MADYHVGCGVFGIYAGILNKKGDAWRNKSEVTTEALDAVAGYLVMHEKEMRFTYKDKRYALRCVEIEDEEDEQTESE